MYTECFGHFLRGLLVPQPDHLLRLHVIPRQHSILLTLLVWQSSIQTALQCWPKRVCSNERNGAVVLCCRHLSILSRRASPGMDASASESSSRLTPGLHIRPLLQHPRNPTLQPVIPQDPAAWHHTTTLLRVRMLRSNPCQPLKNSMELFPFLSIQFLEPGNF